MPFALVVPDEDDLMSEKDFVVAAESVGDLQIGKKLQTNAGAFAAKESGMTKQEAGKPSMRAIPSPLRTSELPNKQQLGIHINHMIGTKQTMEQNRLLQGSTHNTSLVSFIVIKEALSVARKVCAQTKGQSNHTQGSPHASVVVAFLNTQVKFPNTVVPDELKVTIREALSKMTTYDNIIALVRQFRVRQCTRGKELLDTAVVQWQIEMNLPENIRLPMEAMMKAIVNAVGCQYRTEPPPGGVADKKLAEDINTLKKQWEDMRA